APLPVDDDGVDRVDAPGHRVDVVEEVDDPLFERVGDVETVEAEADRRVQQLVQLRPGQPRFGDVAGAVERGDGMGCTFDLVRSRGAGGEDALAEESEEEGGGDGLAFGSRSMRLSIAWTEPSAPAPAMTAAATGER